MGIVLILLALLLPPVQSTCGASRCVPVEVMVFDAASGQPVSGANVDIVRGACARNKREILKQTYSNDNTTEPTAVTADDGLATIAVNCSYGASGERPETHAHLESHWAIVSAQGYGKVVIAVRPNSVAIRQIERDEKLLLPVGMFRRDQSE